LTGVAKSATGRWTKREVITAQNSKYSDHDIDKEAWSDSKLKKKIEFFLDSREK